MKKVLYVAFASCTLIICCTSCLSIIEGVSDFISDALFDDYDDDCGYDDDVDGYSGSYYWESYGCSHTVHIYSDSWSGINNMFGKVEYDSGYVCGDVIYDSTGLIAIARISGNSIRWGTHTLRKE